MPPPKIFGCPFLFASADTNDTLMLQRYIPCHEVPFFSRAESSRTGHDYINSLKLLINVKWCGIFPPNERIILICGYHERWYAIQTLCHGPNMTICIVLRDFIALILLILIRLSPMAMNSGRAEDTDVTTISFATSPFGLCLVQMK